MLKSGDYVRVFSSLKTILGTIEGSKHESGSVKYLFHADPNTAEPIGDFFVTETDVEVCERPGRKGLEGQ